MASTSPSQFLSALGKAPAKPGAKKDDNDADDMLGMAAEDLISAVKKGDSKAAAAAMRRGYQACQYRNDDEDGDEGD